MNTYLKKFINYNIRKILFLISIFLFLFILPKISYTVKNGEVTKVSLTDENEYLYNIRVHDDDKENYTYTHSYVDKDLNPGKYKNILKEGDVIRVKYMYHSSVLSLSLLIGLILLIVLTPIFFTNLRGEIIGFELNRIESEIFYKNYVFVGDKRFYVYKNRVFSRDMTLNSRDMYDIYKSKNFNDLEIYLGNNKKVINKEEKIKEITKLIG